MRKMIRKHSLAKKILDASLGEIPSNAILRG